MLLSIVSSRFRSQLNSVMPFLIPNKPKWLNLSSNIVSLAFSFLNLWNNSFFANSYNSMSSAFNCSTLWRCSGRRCFSVELDTVELCWSNGMAKRKLNVSSNTYWEICKRWMRTKWNSLSFSYMVFRMKNWCDALLFDIRWVRNRTWPLGFAWRSPTWYDHVVDLTSPIYYSIRPMTDRIAFLFDDW